MEGNGLKVISSADSAVLLKVKDTLPRRTLVAVCGRVSALSEIVRISKDYVFLIELDRAVQVVVKQPQYHPWHGQLQVGQKYIFTSLRPTTLSKSHDSAEKVFVPWTGSRVLDSGQCVQLSLKDWLDDQGLSCPQDCEEEEDVLPGSHRTDPLISYQGVVTDTSQEEFNIFTVDSNMRLYLCFQPKLKCPKVLEVGDKISMHNVHQRTCPLTGEKQIFCCMRSTLNVTNKEVGRNPSAAVRDHSTAPPPLFLLSSLTFSAAEVLPLIQLSKDITNVLSTASACTDRSGELPFKVKNVLQQLCGQAVGGKTTRRLRNYLLEFCQHDARCPLACDNKENSSQIPVLAPLLHLTDSRDSADEQAGTSGVDSASEESVWSYSTKTISEEDRKPVLGWLELSTVTGRLQLKNAKETINIVMTGVSFCTALHQCSHACQLISPGERLLCPKIYRDCLGHLVAAVRYCVVTEIFRPRTEWSLAGPQDVQRTKQYMLCSTQDLVLLQKLAVPVSECRKAVGQYRTRQNEDGKQSEDSKPFTAFVLITSKQFLCAGDGRNREMRLQFSAEGQVLIKKDWQEREAPVGSHSLQEEDLAEESAPAKKRQVAKTAENRARRSSRSSSNPSETFSPASSASPVSFEKGQRITLNFSSDSCQWFDIIHPPGVYKISVDSATGEDTPLVWPDMTERLQRAFERAGTRTSVGVAKGAYVDMVYGADVHVADNDEHLQGVEAALSDGQPGHLVSLTGVVIWRHHPPQYQTTEFKTVGKLVRNSRQQRKAEAGTLQSHLGDRCLCLGVRDIESPSVTTSIYFNTQTVAYPLGLIPGVTLGFHCLEKKMSKAERVYFTFLPVSTLTIVSGPVCLSHPIVKNRDEQVSNTQNVNWDDMPTQLLISQWRDPQPPEIFVSQCLIVQFFFVSLKSVCGKCRALFQTTGCSAPACNNTDQSTLSARLSVLVEDGSCQALVSVSNRIHQDLPRRLLLLSEAEWGHLEKAVQKQGELLVQEFGGMRGSVIKEFVSRLCDSVMVKRPCSMLLCKPPVYSKQRAQSGQVAAVDLLTSDDLKLRKINLGETTVETLCLPYLQLNCLAVREI